MMAVLMVVERVDSKVESWEIRLDYQTADMMVGWTVYSLAASKAAPRVACWVAPMVERKELLLAAKWAAWMVFATVDSTVEAMADKSVEQKAA